MSAEGRYPFKLGGVTSVFSIRPGDLDTADETALAAWEFEVVAPGSFISAWARNANFTVGNMKKNVAGQKVGAQLVSATDGSVFTGSVTVYVTGDAGTQAIGSVGAGACTHEGNGYHTYAPAQAETNYDLTAFTFIGTGAVAATVQAYNSFPQTVDLSTGITGGTITNVTTVNGLAAGVITAASIAADAITDAKVAADVSIASVTGAVGSVTGAVGSVTGNVGGNVTGSVGSVVGLTAANLDVAVSTRLAPTVAARTLDVSVTGEAGIDWANVGSPTTAVNLSATNISTSQDVANVLNGVNVVSMQNNVITETVPSADFYTAVTAALWDAATISYAADGSFGELVSLIYSQELLIKAKTDNLPAAPASTTNITAGTITTVTNLTNAPTTGDLTSTMKASVNAEVLDVIATDTYAEPGQGAPASTLSMVAKINYLYKSWRNKKTQTATVASLYADDALTVDHKATVSDDGTTTTVGEMATGP